MTPELRLLGAVALLDGKGTVLSGGAAQPRRLAVLAVLAEASPAPVSRERLIALIWPEHPEGGARRLLTQSLYSLRRDLGDVVTTTGRDVALDPNALSVDLLELRLALNEGEVERALSLHRGPLLQGFFLRGGGEFDRWADGARAGLEREIQRRVEVLVARYDAEGRLRDAARLGARLLEGAPYDAGVVLQCMALWERAGDPAAAIAAAGAYAHRMQTELELEPDARVVRGAAELAARHAAPAQADAPRTSGSARQRARSSPPPARSVATPPSIAGSGEPAPSSPGRPSFARRLPGLTTVGAAMVVLLLAVSALVVGSRAEDRPRLGAPATVVHVQSFAVSNAPDTGRIGDVVAQMLASTLHGSGGATVIAGGADDAAGGTARLTGSVVRSGAQLRLDAELTLKDGVAPVRGSVAGSADSLIALAERLALQLVPAFYDGPAVSELPLQRFRTAQTLRLHLDGEQAMRQGAFASAQAAFAAALALDSTLAWTWYRRAVAADQSYASQAADRAMQRAQSAGARLTAREQLLVRAYARWRAGDVPAADSLYRALLATGPADREAWTHFAEVAYHGGPLHGRPLDAAREAWQRVVALDSGNVPALVHAIRLAARVDDSSAVRALLARAAASGAGTSAFAESRAVAAIAADGVGGAEARQILARLPDYSLYFLHWVVAGILERPADGGAIAALLTHAQRPASMRAEGHVALAHVAAARGQLRQAEAELVLAGRLDAASAAWARAYLVSLPFLETPTTRLRVAERELLASPSSTAGAPLYLQLAVADAEAPMIERYLLQLLRVRLPADSRNPRGGPDCDVEVSATSRALCLDLTAGLHAESSRLGGDEARALDALEGLRVLVPYQLAGRSLYYARTRERFVRAMLLERLGRLDEAYRWYAAVPHGSRLDYVYLAPSHLARGRIREREGDAAAAAGHYRAARDLWRDADPELAWLVLEAEAGLGRIGAH